jgi:Fungal specific transcription factor domain
VALFLDPVLFDCYAPQITPGCQLPIPPQVEACLGDHDSKKVLAAEYFKTAHRWMPIISRIRFYGSLINSLQYTDHGVTSILLAMKLVLSCPQDANLCSEIYSVLKEFQLRMEMAGYLSIYTVQSAILIAMYEMGHAIFPGAFTTISTCARYATALGINEPLQIQGKAWIEQEERNRIWWAILILDR